MTEAADIWNEELFAAIERGHMTIVQRMLARKANRYLYFPPAYSPLHAAILLNRSDIVEALLTQGADVSEKYEGDSPLYTAIGDSEQIVSLLLKHGADPNLPDGSNEEPALDTLTGLMGSARDLDGTAGILLDAGADPNRRSAGGCPVIVAAAHHGRSGIVLELIAHGADVDLSTNDNVTALMVASGKGHAEIVRSLLTAGADPNAVCSNGAGPLSEAIRIGHAEIEHILMSAGADALPQVMVTALREIAEANRHQIVPADIDIAARDENERTPLHNAAEAGRVAIVRRLIELGADLNARDDRRRTPLMLAVAEARREAAAILIDAGADTLALDRYRNSTLEIAVNAWDRTHGWEPAGIPDLREIIRMLLDTGIIARSADGQAWRDAFLEAIKKGFSEIVAMFLEQGADPNNADEDKLPISEAIGKDLYDIFLMLIDAGAEARWDMTAFGETLFYHAVSSGATEIVRYFLSTGADPNSTGDETGSTMLAIAAAQGDSGIVMLLIEAGASLAGRVRHVDNSVYYDWLAAPVRDAALPVLRLLLDAGAPAGDILHEAASNGDLELIKWLIGRGIDINAAGCSGMTPLIAAAYACRKSNDHTLIDWLLDHGADVNAVEDQGDTALKSAVGMSSLVRKLLDAGADPNGGHGATALMAAARAGSTASAILLIAAGADINAVTEDGDTALHDAEYYGHERIKTLLVENGAVYSAIVTENLHAAIRRKKTEDILRLIHEGADIEEPDKYGRSPLLCAIQHECGLSVIEALLTAGANPNHQLPNHRIYGTTALESAVFSGNAGIIKLLLSHGADPNDTRADVMPISRVVCMICRGEMDKNGDLMDIARLLLDAGASPNVHDAGPGYTPLQEAVQADDRALVELLLDYGADPNMPSETGFNLCARTAFAEAVYYGFESLARLLLEWGADVDTKDANGTTPLIYVCGMEAHSPYTLNDDEGDADAECVRQDRGEMILRLGHHLMDRGAAPNHSDCFGRTPLLAACGARDFMESRIELIRTLLDAGANVNVESIYGSTPMICAKEAGAQPLVDMLAAHGAIY